MITGGSYNLSPMLAYKAYSTLVQGLPLDIWESAIWSCSQAETIELLEPLLLDIYTMYSRDSNSKNNEYSIKSPKTKFTKSI